MNKTLISLLVLSVGLSGSAFIVNELILMSISSMILGDGISAISLTIMLMLIGTAIGGALGNFISNKELMKKFFILEVILAIFGAFAPLLIYFIFAYSISFNVYLYVVILVIGFFIGFEVPLLLRIIQSLNNDLEESLSALYFSEYIGSAIGIYIWVNYLLFNYQLVQISFLVSSLNLTVAFISFIYYMININYFREIEYSTQKIIIKRDIDIDVIKGKSTLKKEDDLNNLTSPVPLSIIEIRNKIIGIFVFYSVSIGVLYYGFSNAKDLTFKADQKLFNGAIIMEAQTKYQKITITENHKTSCVEMFLNYSLQFNSCDEVIYHESLIVPLMSSVKNPKNILIIGGGDGIVANNIRKINNTLKITQIDLDREMIELARNNEILRGINNNIYDSIQYIEPKGINSNNNSLDIIISDVSLFLNSIKNKWDLIVVDLPDPKTTELSKLYTDYFYSKLSTKLTEKGVIVIQSTSPFYLNDVYNCIGSTLDSVFPFVKPYHVNVPSFGEWGFYLASNHDIEFNNFSNNYKFMTKEFMNSMFVFPNGILKKSEVNSLLNPLIARYYSKEILRLF